MKIVPNRAYVDIFMELMKKIVGNGVWKLYLGKGVNEREDKNQFIQDFSLSDETFLFWMLDAYWNKWIQQMRPDLGDQIVNDLISKESNVPEEKWLSKGRPAKGSWFMEKEDTQHIKASREGDDDDEKERHQHQVEKKELNDLGWDRWNHWYLRVKMMRADPNYSTWIEFLSHIVAVENKGNKGVHNEGDELDEPRWKTMPMLCDLDDPF